MKLLILYISELEVNNNNNNNLRFQQDFRSEVHDLNDVKDEKLNEAIILSYDKVNLRISVTLLFPEPICVKASIAFKGRTISHGSFEIIVLSSSDTTLVHKNISKRNICYEARLLNLFSQQKAKPRKVVCYVGPKQVNSLIPKISKYFLQIMYNSYRLRSRRKY